METLVEDLEEQLRADVAEGQELLAEVAEEPEPEPEVPVALIDEEPTEAAAPRRSTRSNKYTGSYNNFQAEMWARHAHKCFVQAYGNENLKSMLDDAHQEREQLHHSFAQQFNLKQGLKEFGAEGEASAMKEIGQIHGRGSITPVHLRDLTDEEAKRALDMVTVMLRKKSGVLKTRMCINGSSQKNWMSKEEITSPTAAPQAVLLSAAIDAYERRYVATVDVPNAFMQAKIDTKPGDPRVILVLRGQIVDMLCSLDKEMHAPYVEYHKGKKVLFLVVHRAIYGLVQSPMLWYKAFRKEIEDQGFTVNPYDPCVANKMVDGSMLTLLWHVDDVKVSHKKKGPVEDFLKWLDSKYSDENGKVTITRGKVHVYLGMVLDFSVPGVLKIDMVDYVKEMLKKFLEHDDLVKDTDAPWSDKLFAVDEKSKKLTKEKAETFHTFVAKALFVSQRSRPDIQPVVAFLTTRVQAPTQQDWKKLVKMMRFLKKTQDVVLSLNVEKMILRWYWDASFAVHPDYKSHTGGTLTMGKGCILSSSKKQKLNTRSSTEAELVAVDDGMGLMLWSKLFLEAQGHAVEDNVLYQDNKSAILLEKNGKASSTKRTRHLNIRYFFVTDQVSKGNLRVEYCPTDQMLADYFTKPTTGAKFWYLWKMIMNPDSRCEDTGEGQDE